MIWRPRATLNRSEMSVVDRTMPTVRLTQYARWPLKTIMIGLVGLIESTKFAPP